MLEGIPSVRLSNERESQCLEIMLKGNTLRNQWANRLLGNKSRRKFCDIVLKIKGQTPNPGSWDDVVATCKDKELVAGIDAKIPEGDREEFCRDWEAIIAVTKVEWEMTCAYVNFARDAAHRWAWLGRASVVTDNGVYGQEAWLALRNAIYGYQRPLKFSTYAHRCLRNHLMSVFSSSGVARYFGKEERTLLREFKAFRSKINDRVSFDEVAIRMGLTAEQTGVLTQMLTTMVHQSQLTGDDRERSKLHDNDITALRRGADSDPTGQPEFLAESFLLDKVREAKLSMFEEEVFLTSLPGRSYYGWQTDIANKYVNPNTQRKYTRAAVALALDSACRKIRRLMKYQEAA